MSKIEKMATRIAAEMVEAHLNHGALIDSDEIAEKACEIAYKIHEKSKAYESDDDGDLSEKKVKKLIKEMLKEYRQEVNIQHASGSGASSHNMP